MDKLIKYFQAGTDSLREVALYYILMVAISAWAFSYFEGIAYFDALYWANVTATSTGYGDISPKTVGGKITAVLTMIGVLFVIAPMIIYRMIELLSPDQHTFTEEEQQQSVAREEEMLMILREWKVKNP